MNSRHTLVCRQLVPSLASISCSPAAVNHSMPRLQRHRMSAATTEYSLHDHTAGRLKARSHRMTPRDATHSVWTLWARWITAVPRVAVKAKFHHASWFGAGSKLVRTR